MRISTIVLLSVLATAVHATKPPTPLVQKNGCPYELCRLGEMESGDTIDVYAQEGVISRPLFKLKPGERFHADRSDVYIDEPGLAVVTAPFRSFKKGDRLYILSYAGEGIYEFWEQGAIAKGGIGVGDKREDDVLYSTSVVARLIRHPDFTWWVHIVNHKHQTGWIAIYNVSADGFAGNVRIMDVRSSYYHKDWWK